MEVQEQLEALPGFDILQSLWDEYAGSHLQTKDPYEDENGNRLKLPSDICTKSEQKLFRSIQKKAWVHDKCFLGSCGIGMDCGLGLVPLVVLFFPVVGPLLMYVVHQRLIQIAADEMKLPPKLYAKLNANIGFDLLITFPPVFGCFFGWMNQCSTRNAALIYDYMVFAAQTRKLHPSYGGRGAIAHDAHFGTVVNQPQPQQQPQNSRSIELDTRPRKQKTFGSKPSQNTIVVGSEQQMGFV